MSSFYLKLIAVITMLIDHIGAIFMEGTKYYFVFRIIGRLAFPIFCFLLVEGFYHTRDVKKYILRLGVFALLSEIPFDIALFQNIWFVHAQNVYFTLTLGLSAIWAVDTIKKRFDPITATLCNILVITLFCYLADYLQSDYGAGGVLFILLFYLFRNNKMILTVAIFALTTLLFGYIEPFGTLAMIFIYFYNGEKGKSLKYVFYGFYPVHLFLLFMLHRLIL